jgi:hypothetical protein
MSGIVNDTDLSALAAEYVIGTLDPDERASANAQLEIDEGFRALVRGWERRLGELHLMVEPVEPDGRIWDRISDRMGMRTKAPPPSAPPPFEPSPFVPPPFAPQPAATPVAMPFAATVSTPLPAPPSAAAAPVASALEPSFESKFEPAPHTVRPLPSAPTFPPPPPPPQPQQSVPRTPEQELASLIAEADKFTTQLSDLASAPPAPETGEELPAEPQPEPLEESVSHDAVPHHAASHADSLLAEAADAITVKPSVEPDHDERAAEVWPDEAAETQELPPPIRDSGPGRDSTMLMSPADAARITVYRQQRRIGRWRAAALLMAFLTFGLFSLIATWRFAPDRLPQPLQPIAVLGLGEWSPTERTPAEHGTQFEE